MIQTIVLKLLNRETVFVIYYKMQCIFFSFFDLIVEDPCLNDDFSGFTGEKCTLPKNN